MLEEKPTTPDLQYVADSSAVSRWKGIGRRLGVSEDVLDLAEQTYPLSTQSAPTERFMHVLKAWHGGSGIIDGKPVLVTYSSLYDALKENGYEEVSDKLKELC